MKFSGLWEKMKKPESKRFWIILISGALLVAAGTIFIFVKGSSNSLGSSGTKAGTTYQTAKVLQRDVRVSINGSGTLITRNSVDLNFPTQGILTELNVKLGDTVKTGDVLASIEGSETLKANVSSAKLELLEAQKDLDDLQKNADVALAQAYQDWVTAKEKYETAQTEVQHISSSRCSDTVTTGYAAAVENLSNKLKELTEGSAQYIETKSRYDTAVANYNYCISYTSGEKAEAQANLELADAAQKSAELTYNTLKEGSGIDPMDLQLAEAKVTEAQDKLAEAQAILDGITLIAPMDGVVTYLAVEEGSLVDTSLFITISDLSNPFVQVNVDESDLPLFIAGSNVEVIFDALPDYTFTGTLIQIDPQLVNTNMVQTAQGLIELDPSTTVDFQTIPLGLNAGVEIISSEVKDAVVAPVEAVHDLGDGDYAVFKIDDDGKLRLHTVEVGLSDSTYIQITNGLTVGETVSTGMLSTMSQ
ncbi:MAG: efflux RND transporter periplasmic adaptor subunit [Anaerolineaceae bacterium]